MRARTVAAVWAGKAAGAASRLLGRGGGTAIAGVVAERVDPQIVGALGRQAAAGTMCVTGTNGKTTTSLMLSRIAREAGYAPLHNRSGSNLMRGFAATLVAAAGLDGRINGAAQRLAIFETDEAVLPHLARAVPPRAIVFLNLFRDQLDRFGEVDAVAGAWEEMIAGFSRHTAAAPVLVLNADDPAVAHLGRAAAVPVVYYGIEDTSIAVAETEHASDYRTCLECGAELAYSVTFYGHIGHWRCGRCGNARSRPDVRVERLALMQDASVMEVALQDEALRVRLPMAGVYNAYNALAAIAGATALAMPRAAIVRALEGFSAAFGRQERFTIDGREVQVLLGKNPAGLNQVLRTLAARADEKRLVFILNDGLADGRDISWIWDADYELLRAQCAHVVASGTRAEDMALRLKYAGYGADPPLVRDRAAALRSAIDATPAGGTLYVIPTYTAMLESRALLAKWSGTPPFWEDA